MKYIAHYILTFIVTALFDLVWITLVAKRLYTEKLGDMLRTGFDWISIGLFYIVLPIGIYILVVQPALQATTQWYTVAMRGAVLGLVAYSTFALTNQALIKGWHPILTVSDIAWGTVLCAAASLIVWAILRA